MKPTVMSMTQEALANATLAAEANYMAHVVDKFGGPIMFGGPILGQVGHGGLRNVVNDHLKEPKL